MPAFSKEVAARYVVNEATKGYIRGEAILAVISAELLKSEDAHELPKNECLAQEFADKWRSFTPAHKMPRRALSKEFGKP